MKLIDNVSQVTRLWSVQVAGIGATVSAIWLTMTDAQRQAVVDALGLSPSAMSLIGFMAAILARVLKQDLPAPTDKGSGGGGGAVVTVNAAVTPPILSVALAGVPYSPLLVSLTRITSPSCTRSSEFCQGPPLIEYSPSVIVIGTSIGTSSPPMLMYASIPVTVIALDVYCTLISAPVIASKVN